MIIDIHSHGPRAHPSIRNVRLGHDAIPAHDPVSIGIHPWDAANSTLRLPDKGQWPTNAVAVGECGLDRVCDAPFSQQLVVFKRQIEMAEELRLPLIVHCVRAFHEVVGIRIQLRAQQPWIIHGFNKGGDALDHVLRAGLYVSFGAAVLDASTPAAWACRLTPANRLLVETDDVDVDIWNIVAAIAQLREESLDVVTANLSENVKTAKLLPTIPTHKT